MHRLRSSTGSYKTSETLLGIETKRGGTVSRKYFSYKTSETLLGIETNLMNALPILDLSLQNL